jgi:hypothetical protein
MSLFSKHWKILNTIEKAEKLSKSEIEFCRDIIKDSQKKGLTSSKTIALLQKTVPKLAEKWRAERVYWTEVKKDDTDMVANAGDDLGIDKYRVILSPHACPLCIRKTDNGEKIFKSNEAEKSGYGHVPPFHPNCYCLWIPAM